MYASVKFRNVKALIIKSQEDKDEEAELLRRKKNSVIVHGVSESNSADSSQREVDDLCVVAAMMQEEGCEYTKVSKAIRLGKKPDTGMKPRSMKLVLETEEKKMSLLKKAKKLEIGQGRRMEYSVYPSRLNTEGKRNDVTHVNESLHCKLVTL